MPRRARPIVARADAAILPEQERYSYSLCYVSKGSAYQPEYRGDAGHSSTAHAALAPGVEKVLKLIGNVSSRADEPGHAHTLRVDQRGLAHRDGSPALGVDDRIEQSLDAWDFYILSRAHWDRI
jgi:hypothetical protein